MHLARSLIRVLAGAGALSLCGGGLAADAEDALLYEALNDCIDMQFERSPAPDSFSAIDLAADCPDLSLSLVDSDWVDRIALAHPESASLAQLADLRYFLRGAYVRPEDGLQLDYTSLESILAETLDTRDRDRNWWRRFIHWLQQRHQRRDDADMRWLEDLLDSLTLSKTTAVRLAYGFTTALMLLAIALVVNEIRLARAGRPAPRPRATERDSSAHDARPASAGSDRGAAPPPCGVPELLNLCIDHLIRDRRLPEARSRTNREFLRHLLGCGDSAAHGFEYLLQQAECVLYGGWRIDAQTLRQCHLEAAALLEMQGAANTAGALPPAGEDRP